MKNWVILLTICLLLTGCAQPDVIEPTEIVNTSAPKVTEPMPMEIPTDPPQKSTEEPAQPPEPADDALVRVADYIPGIRQSLAYATEGNFTGQQIYNFADAYLRYGTVKKLKAVCEELSRQGLGILIWDGFRSLTAQEKLWEICPDPAYVSHPVTGTRSHCRGSAVDLTLVDLKTGAELEMPTDFDDFSERADRDYADCSKEAAENARLLEEIMVKYGIKPYSAEWWHYSDSDPYPVEEIFQPEQTVFDGGIG